MRSNGLLKWLMIPVAILVLFVGIRLFSGGSTSAPPASDAGAQLTPEEMKALGIEGDTPKRTSACVSARTRSTSASTLRWSPSAPTCGATRSRRPARASRPKGYSPTYSGAWTALVGAVAAMPICPWAWGCRGATRPGWKAACAGLNRMTRSLPRDATGGAARLAA